MIHFYSTTWCGDCIRSKALLDSFHLDYRVVDLEQDPKSAETVIKLNNGLRRIPTIVFDDGSILVEPNNNQLIEKLQSLKYI